MNDLPRQKLREIIVQHGRALCDDPKRCEAFLRDYCGQYGREIFILISALKKGVVKDILNSSNIPVELLLGRLTKQMQNDLGLTEEAARYAVESWAMVLDKMTSQQIQQPIIKPPTTISRNQQSILKSTYPKVTPRIQEPIIKPSNTISRNQQPIVKSIYLVPTEIFQIDYTNLERLLQSQNFRAADTETGKIILAVVKRGKEGWLRIEDVKNFPCKELRSIDKLWLKYSGGKFGISVQQQIYQSLGGTKKFNYDLWKYMGERVGWRLDGDWISYSDYDFSQTAPFGHLPAVGPYRAVSAGPSLLLRYAECNT
ncbi:hypothetical protein B7O87_05040 [Cylindrospermopsis raciborskii CENA303]|uniref:GUN4-like domain-containing protein n=1 Tax=Cylindrospermopsis raciborskii CENA303 TaxID=1170769 RepID=A0A1X4G9U5_9CYAN|nr:GUN4 domain-containing protein [Cylindrospermopsis raciborskii]OSO93918.1 hypothetical protein B7O87_05040 [Cylindrospermopsis raciborskii CENA303]